MDASSQRYSDVVPIYSPSVGLPKSVRIEGIFFVKSRSKNGIGPCWSSSGRLKILEEIKNSVNPVMPAMVRGRDQEQ